MVHLSFQSYLKDISYESFRTCEFDINIFKTYGEVLILLYKTNTLKYFHFLYYIWYIFEIRKTNLDIELDLHGMYSIKYVH